MIKLMKGLKAFFDPVSCLVFASLEFSQRMNTDFLSFLTERHHEPLQIHLSGRYNSMKRAGRRPALIFFMTSAALERDAIVHTKKDYLHLRRPAIPYHNIRTGTRQHTGR